MLGMLRKVLAIFATVMAIALFVGAAMCLISIFVLPDRAGAPSRETLWIYGVVGAIAYGGAGAAFLFVGRKLLNKGGRNQHDNPTPESGG